MAPPSNKRQPNHDNSAESSSSASKGAGSTSTNSTGPGGKRVQVSSCDICKDQHRKCDGDEPCTPCRASNLPCSYHRLRDAKRRAHEAHVLAKKQAEVQRLKNPEFIVAQLGNLSIAGSSDNFGPIISQVINMPRYEPTPLDFANSKEKVERIGDLEEFLIDCYFSNFNHYIPILNRKEFMTRILDPVQLDTIEVQKLLACVLATGFAYRLEMGDQDLIQRMQPNYGSIMCRRFHHFNAQDVLNSSMESCQSYLVLTGFYASVTNYDAVHNLVALAHSMAVGMGLNRVKGLYYQRPYRDNVPHTEETLEFGRRVYWSIVIVCSGYSLSHQSPLITSKDYDIQFPKRLPSDLYKDFRDRSQDDFEGIKEMEHFAPMFEITSLIADVTCTAVKQGLLTRVDEMRERLVEWRTKLLPQRLRITPTDTTAIQRQSRWVRFYHAISYMFEICLHHTFQLHDSHRAMGVHGLWDSYCFSAAEGIKNIYKVLPMTKLNAHVVLPVAAGACANTVASKVVGRAEAAQKMCDEIKVILEAFIRASNSMERDRLMMFVPHSYNGVTQFADSPVGAFDVHAPESPPWNERSPPPPGFVNQTQEEEIEFYNSEGESDSEGNGAESSISPVSVTGSTKSGFGRTSASIAAGALSASNKTTATTTTTATSIATITTTTAASTASGSNTTAIPLVPPPARSGLQQNPHLGPDYTYPAEPQGYIQYTIQQTPLPSVAQNAQQQQQYQQQQHHHQQQQLHQQQMLQREQELYQQKLAQQHQEYQQQRQQQSQLQEQHRQQLQQQLQQQQTRDQQGHPQQQSQQQQQQHSAQYPPPLGGGSGQYSFDIQDPMYPVANIQQSTLIFGRAPNQDQEHYSQESISKRDMLMGLHNNVVSDGAISTTSTSTTSTGGSNNNATTTSTTTTTTGPHGHLARNSSSYSSTYSLESPSGVTTNGTVSSSGSTLGSASHQQSMLYSTNPNTGFFDQENELTMLGLGQGSGLLLGGSNGDGGVSTSAVHQQQYHQHHYQQQHQQQMQHQQMQKQHGMNELDPLTLELEYMASMGGSIVVGAGPNDLTGAGGIGIHTNSHRYSSQDGLDYQQGGGHHNLHDPNNPLSAASTTSTSTVHTSSHMGLSNGGFEYPVAMEDNSTLMQYFADPTLLQEQQVFSQLSSNTQHHN